MPHGGVSFSRPPDMSAVGNQNLMKLRVNRVAIIQELKPEHVVGHLSRHGVLTPDEMRQVCTDTRNPVIRLLDILSRKENRTQWYVHFLNALRHAEVDSDQKRRYRRLVDFLENTIIRFPPKRGASFPQRYEPLPAIGGARQSQQSTVTPQESSTDTPGHESVTPHSSVHTTPGPLAVVAPQTETTTEAFNTETNNGEKPEPEPSGDMMLISGHYHQWVQSPLSHTSRLPEPSDILIALETDDDTAFHEQIQAEKITLQRMKELEVLYLMHKQKRLPQGFVLCMADCVTQIVDDLDNHHLYVKYFLKLKHDFNWYIIRELVGSYSNWLMATKLGDVQKNADLLQRATKFGFNLFDLLDELGDYACAEGVISVLTAWLMVQPCLETWMHGYNACVRLTRIRIRNYEFTAADKALNSAIQYLNAIKLMSFGKELVDESEKMVATAWLMMELGSHHTAYHWAHDGLKEVRAENKRGIVNALCVGVTCYAGRYNIRRAHELAVEAVRQAESYFGRVHPMFVKARLTYVELINQFCQPSDKTIKIALDTLHRCEMIYHCDSMLLARAHMAASNAYISANKLTDEKYLTHAHKAQRTAMNCVPGIHPILALYSEHLARCLLIKSRQVPKPAPAPDTLAAMKITSLVYAASELSVAYRIYCPCFGTNSYRAATAQAMLAQIMEEENNLEDAMTLYEDCLATYQVCLSRSSPYIGQLKARMARFYYNKGHLNKALELMDSIVQPMIKDGQIDSGPIRVAWQEDVFRLYLTAISDLNDQERLTSATELRDSWLTRTHYLQPLTLAELGQKTNLFLEFQKSFMLWRKVEVKRVNQLGEQPSDSETEATRADS